MRRFYQIMIGYLLISIFVITGANVGYRLVQDKQAAAVYKIELNRLNQWIQTEGYEKAATKQYETLESIDCLRKEATSEEIQRFYEGFDENCDYEAVTDSNGELLIVKVCYDKLTGGNHGQAVMNLALTVILLLALGILWIIQVQIIKPFHTIADLPYELSKGNLVPSLKESRYRYFGRFLWGLDLLRQKLEKDKQDRLELEREKKMLILSISHDINTPLSSIKMSARALSEGLYQEPEKNKALASMIEKNAGKIEEYVSQIKQASKEDFMKFTVVPSEFYLKELMNKVLLLYRERCSQSLTELIIGQYSNQLIAGDFERCMEVIQNILENAIKYGDGKYIRISFDREEEFRLIHIANSGNSLEEKELVHVFESFYRGSNAASKQGSGLGLYICKQLMLAMDGDIYASQKEDEFEVTVVMRIA